MPGGWQSAHLLNQFKLMGLVPQVKANRWQRAVKRTSDERRNSPIRGVWCHRGRDVGMLCLAPCVFASLPSSLFNPLCLTVNKRINDPTWNATLAALVRFIEVLVLVACGLLEACGYD